MLEQDIAVIGGGAAGLMAAISAALVKPHLYICIIEKQDRVGRKLLATGNGRCNLSNQNLKPENWHGHNPAFAAQATTLFDYAATKAWFRQLGILFKVEDAGKAYPYSLQANAVLDALRFKAQDLHIKTITQTEICNLKKQDDALILSNANYFLKAKRAIITTGGLAAPDLGAGPNCYQLLLNCGHTLTPTAPRLVPLKVDHWLPRSLKGIKIDAACSLNQGSPLAGEVLFTEYGLSGPPILQLAGQLNAANNIIYLDLLPDFSETELASLLSERQALLGYLTLEDFLSGLLPKRLGQMLLKLYGYTPLNRPVAELPGAALASLASGLKHVALPVSGHMGWARAQVTAGGIATEDFVPQTMASKLCPGLYAAGEVLDINGDCGGYNLQWAWTSGHLAGKSAALSLGAL